MKKSILTQPLHQPYLQPQPHYNIPHHPPQHYIPIQPQHPQPSSFIPIIQNPFQNNPPPTHIYHPKPYIPI